jgi:hypothetical protein
MEFSTASDKLPVVTEEKMSRSLSADSHSGKKTWNGVFSLQVLVREARNRRRSDFRKL